MPDVSPPAWRLPLDLNGPTTLCARPRAHQLGVVPEPIADQTVEQARREIGVLLRRDDAHPDQESQELLDLARSSPIQQLTAD